VCAIMLVSPAEDKAVSSVDILSVWRMLMPACMLRMFGAMLGLYGKPYDSPASPKKAITCGGRHGVDIPYEHRAVYYS
jgi:hypothetical protein